MYVLIYVQDQDDEAYLQQAPLLQHWKTLSTILEQIPGLQSK